MISKESSPISLNKPLSIIICGVQWPPETFLLRLFKGLSQAGFSVIVACNQKPTRDWLSAPGESWLWKPSWNVNHLKRIVNLMPLLFKVLFSKPLQKRTIFHLLSQQEGIQNKLFLFFQVAPLVGLNFDLVYFPWVLAAAEYIEFFESLKTPMVISLRGSMINVDPWVSKAENSIKEKLRFIFDHDIRVHCVSQDILEEAIHYGLDRKKAVVIRPAVDPAYFTPSIQPSNNPRFRVITTGSLIWRKGYEYALLAVKQLIDASIDAEFHIIGEGPERQRILFTVNDLGLEERVILHGKLPPDEVRSQLQQSDIFLLSSLSEGISNAVLEAMSCGLPVVTTDCGGMREAVTNGVEGIVVPVRNPDLMAEALTKLARDNELRLRMGEAGRARIIHEFDLKDQARAFVKLFSQTKVAAE